jgi:cytosine/uracil/thiamine/allantoin permease
VDCKIIGRRGDEVSVKRPSLSWVFRKRASSWLAASFTMPMLYERHGKEAGMNVSTVLPRVILGMLILLALLLLVAVVGYGVIVFAGRY